MATFDRTQLAALLENSVAALPFDVSQAQQQKLLDYLQLIHKWNKAYNLTSVRNPEEMLAKHIVDSIAVMPYLKGQQFIDVGTGPGLPGIPLAIMLPNAHFTLLDSLGKRVRFMKQCAHELALTNVSPVQSRVEDHQPTALYDGVISRAFASLKDMLHWCQHLVDSTGAFFALKGQMPEQELDEISTTYTIDAVHSVDVPGLVGQRHLIVIKTA